MNFLTCSKKFKSKISHWYGGKVCSNVDFYKTTMPWFSCFWFFKLKRELERQSDFFSPRGFLFQTRIFVEDTICFLTNFNDFFEIELLNFGFKLHEVSHTHDFWFGAICDKYYSNKESHVTKIFVHCPLLWSFFLCLPIISKKKPTPHTTHTNKFGFVSRKKYKCFCFEP